MARLVGTGPCWPTRRSLGDGAPKVWQADRAIRQYGKAWANLGGNWGPGGFSAGGRVEDSGQGVVRVRLTDAEGRTFEDTVNDGVVLFMSEEPVAMPMRVELYDADGRAVATDEWGFRDE